jgi:hypothetical protein
LKVLGFWYSPRLIDGGANTGTQCQSQSEHPSKESDLLCTEFQLLQGLLVLRSTNFQSFYEHMMMLAEAMKFGMTLHAMRLL